MRSCLSCIFTLILALVLLAPPVALTQSLAPGQIAEQIRATLVQVQLQMHDNPAEARALLAGVRDSYTSLAPTIALYASAADARARTGFIDAERALIADDAPAFAVARARIWTALLAGGYAVVLGSLHNGDASTAQQWLTVREFRHATRFTRPNADASRAVYNATMQTMPTADTIPAVQADLLDTYQARLNEALQILSVVDQQDFAARRAEAAALAEGYFAILAPAYAEQRGNAATDAARAAFVRLREAALAGADLAAPLATVEQNAAWVPRGAAQSGGTETAHRQMLRFLQLVPVEYERGIRNGQVTIDLEIREAITFHAGAFAAFTDLRDLLAQRDAVLTERVAAQFNILGTILASAGNRSAVADPEIVRSSTTALLADLTALLPQEWQKQDSGADFDVIRTALDQMEQAVRAGEYELAESARLEAYAIMEIGPEVKLIAFAPQYRSVIEGYFWYGQGERKGLAYLIERRAAPAEIAATRAALDQVLAEAEQALAGKNAPAAIATNAMVIVFREGLEAVLILASLMGSLKVGAQRRFRTPLWIGVVLALIASVATWMLAQGALMAMARFGETLEAIVSLIAIAVLLLITNWFFHDVYWKDWMANFHQQKKRILSGQTGAVAWFDCTWLYQHLPRGV